MAMFNKVISKFLKKKSTDLFANCRSRGAGPVNIFLTPDAR